MSAYEEGIWIAMWDREEIGSHYSKYFRMSNVNTEELKTIAYKLRHSVFHEESGYHGLGNSSYNNMELDEYDEYSLHSLLFHKPTNRAIGYIRLIPQIKKLNNQLPVEKYYGKPFDFSATCINKIQRKNMGEISRMAIMSSFRQRLSDNYRTDQESLLNQSENIVYINKRYPINYLPICLISAAIYFLFKENMEYGIAMVEPRLAILLRRFGVQFDQIGKPFECFGTRVPYVFYRERTYKNLTPEFRSLFDKISRELTE